MVSTLKTPYLGQKDKVSEKGNPYTVISFMDEGEAVSAIARENVKIPSGLVPLCMCDITVRTDLSGRYIKAEVISIERSDD